MTQATPPTAPPTPSSPDSTSLPPLEGPAGSPRGPPRRRRRGLLFPQRTLRGRRRGAAGAASHDGVSGGWVRIRFPHARIRPSHGRIYDDRWCGSRMRRRWPPVRGCARGGSTETAMQTAGTTTLCRANCGGGVCRRTASHGRDNCGSVRGCVALVLRHVAHAGGRPTVAGPARHLTSLGGCSGVSVAWLRPRRGAVVAQRFLHPVAQGAAPRSRTPSLRRW